MTEHRRTNTHRNRRIGALLLILAMLAAFVGGCCVGRQSPAPSSSAPTSSAPVIPSVSSDPTSSEPGDTTVRPVATATVVNTGDILIHSPLLSRAAQADGSYNFDWIFPQVESYIQAADLATINLELTLPGSDYSGYPSFHTPDSVVDALQRAGFGLVTTANNHSNDSRAAGFLRTMQVLREKGMPFIGTREQPEDKIYRVMPVNGISFGMINYTYGALLEDGRKSLNGIPCTEQTSRLLNMFVAGDLQPFYDEMAAAIAAMKQDGAEVIVAYMHWGNEYRLTSTAGQREMAQKLCDMGVDVIVGSHPHVVEPVELLTSDISGKTTLCVYSMGNSVSNQRINQMGGIAAGESGHTEDGMLFSFTVTKFSDGTVRLTGADILPTWVHMYKENNQRVYQIVPLDKTVADWESAFGLNRSSTGLRDAQNSYDRTMKTIGAGLEAWQAYFAALQVDE